MSHALKDFAKSTGDFFRKPLVRAGMTCVAAATFLSTQQANAQKTEQTDREKRSVVTIYLGNDYNISNSVYDRGYNLVFGSQVQLTNPANAMALKLGLEYRLFPGDPNRYEFHSKYRGPYTIGSTSYTHIPQRARGFVMFGTSDGGWGHLDMYAGFDAYPGSNNNAIEYSNVMGGVKASVDLFSKNSALNVNLSAGYEYKVYNNAFRDYYTPNTDNSSSFSFGAHLTYNP